MQMASKFKDEDGVTFDNIKSVHATSLLSDGMHLGRKGITKCFHKLKWIIIKGIKKSDI